MNKRYLLAAFMMLTAASSTLYAQDLRERNYYFENLTWHTAPWVTHRHLYHLIILANRI